MFKYIYTTHLSLEWRESHWSLDNWFSDKMYTVHCTPPHKCFDDSVKFAIYLVSRIFRCCQRLKKISVNVHHAFSQPGEPKNWPELYKYCMNIFKREWFMSCVHFFVHNTKHFVGSVRWNLKSHVNMIVCTVALCIAHLLFEFMANDNNEFIN